MALLTMMCVYIFVTVSAIKNMQGLSKETQLTRLNKRMTCRSRCDALADSPYLCSCDKKCYTYGDCCWDYFRECTKFHINNVPEVNISDSSVWTQKARNYIMGNAWGIGVSKCVSVSKHPLRKVLIVSSCAERHDNEDRCEMPDSNKFSDSIPIYDTKTKLVYQNIFCAMCNGVLKNSSQLIPFKIQMLCLDFNQTFTSNHFNDRRDLLSCRMSSEIPVNATEFKDDSRCSSISSQLVSDCPIHAVNSSIAFLCSAILAPFETNNNSSKIKMFKNSFCAACHNIPWNMFDSFTRNPISERLELSFRYSFQIQFDFRNDYSIHYVSHIRKEISRNDLYIHDKYNLTAALTFRIKASSGDLISDFVSTINVIVFNISTRNLTSECHPTKPFQMYTLVPTDELEMAVLIPTVDKFIRNDSSNTVHYLEVRALDYVSRDCGTKTLQLMKSSSDKNQTDYIWATNNTISFIWKRTRCENKEMSRYEVSYICRDFSWFGCTNLTVNENLTSLDEHIQFLLKTIGHFRRSLLYKDNTTFIHAVCLLTEEYLPIDQTAALVDVILLAISLGGLVLTFGTHVSVKGLRTTAGIYTMNLIFSMICWHILYFVFVSTNVPQPKGWKCKCLGYARLYLFMVAFFWQTCLAVDIAWKLTHTVRPHKKHAVNRNLGISSAICWGVPLLLNSTTGTLSYKGVIGSTFSEGNGCGMSTKYDLHVLLYLTMALCLTVSFACFIVCFLVLYKNKKATRELQATRVKQGEMVTCVKIFILVGMPWVLIILGNASKVNIIWKVGTSVCASQGFLLTVVLLTNKKVYTTLRSLFKINFHSK